MATEQELAQIRATADAIIARAADDAEFNARIERDPVGTLEASGLSTDYANALATEYTLLDAAGFQKGSGCSNFGMTCFFVNWTIADGKGPCRSCFSLLKDP